MKKWIPHWLGMPRLDPVMLLLIGLVMAVGLFMVYSASGQNPALVERQAIRLGLGLVAMLMLSQVPPHILRAWTPWLYLAGLVLLVATWFLASAEALNVGWIWVFFGFSLPRS